MSSPRVETKVPIADAVSAIEQAVARRSGIPASTLNMNVQAIRSPATPGDTAIAHS